MALNKTILKKVSEKTVGKKKQQEFIISILDEENRGIGHYKKFYKELIEKAAKDGE
ncbi:MAG: hypothetical protein PHD70_10410 [Anaerostipes sp.]|nr:hypothetical protein [Anaerostipes sp.]